MKNKLSASDKQALRILAENIAEHEKGIAWLEAMERQGLALSESEKLLLDHARREVAFLKQAAQRIAEGDPMDN